MLKCDQCPVAFRACSTSVPYQDTGQPNPELPNELLAGCPAFQASSVQSSSPLPADQGVAYRAWWSPTWSSCFSNKGLEMSFDLFYGSCFAFSDCPLFQALIKNEWRAKCERDLWLWRHVVKPGEEDGKYWHLFWIRDCSFVRRTQNVTMWLQLWRE